MEKVEPVQVASHYAWGTNRACECNMAFYMASNGSCFIITWTISKNHFLKVGLIENRETMALQTLTTIDLFYWFIMFEDLYE